jgi:Spy/CpxP family protein refolding chaperone
MNKSILLVVVTISILSSCTHHFGRNDSNYGRHGHGMEYGRGYGSGCYDQEDEMQKLLNLTDDQTKKIINIDSKYREKYYANRGNYKKMESLRTEHRKDIEKVLTPEQRKEYSNQYNRRWRGRGPGSDYDEMGPGMMNPGGGGGGGGY